MKFGKDQNNNKPNKFANANKDLDGVRTTKSGKINSSYKPNLSNSNQSSKKSKSKTQYGNVRLDINLVAKLNSYQKLRKFKNRSEALNDLLNKVISKEFDDKQKNEINMLDDLFLATHKSRTD